MASALRGHPVTADHRLAQSYDARSGKIELPNKLGAMQVLAKMRGWQAPERHEIDHNFKEQQELIEVRGRADVSPAVAFELAGSLVGF